MTTAPSVSEGRTINEQMALRAVPCTGGMLLSYPAIYSTLIKQWKSWKLRLNWKSFQEMIHYNISRLRFILLNNLALAANETSMDYFYFFLKKDFFLIFFCFIRKTKQHRQIPHGLKITNLPNFAKCFVWHQGASQLTMGHWCASGVPPRGRLEALSHC